MLLQRSVHVQLLPVPPPPLDGVRAHLDARADAPALASPGGEDLWYSSVPIQSPISSVQSKRTLVPLHPSLYAASFATSSPNPSISPLTKGRIRLIAAPRSRPQSVGGEYRIRGEELDGGEGEALVLGE